MDRHGGAGAADVITWQATFRTRIHEREKRNDRRLLPDDPILGHDRYRSRAFERHRSDGGSPARRTTYADIRRVPFCARDASCGAIRYSD